MRIGTIATLVSAVTGLVCLVYFSAVDTSYPRLAAIFAAVFVLSCFGLASRLR